MHQPCSPLGWVIIENSVERWYKEERPGWERLCCYCQTISNHHGDEALHHCYHPNSIWHNIWNHVGSKKSLQECFSLFFFSPIQSLVILLMLPLSPCCLCYICLMFFYLSHFLHNTQYLTLPENQPTSINRKLLHKYASQFYLYCSVITVSDSSLWIWYFFILNIN